jgi:hypothetical protein
LRRNKVPPSVMTSDPSPDFGVELGKGFPSASRNRGYDAVKRSRRRIDDLVGGRDRYCRKCCRRAG